MGASRSPRAGLNGDYLTLSVASWWRFTQPCLPLFSHPVLVKQLQDTRPAARQQHQQAAPEVGNA